MTLYVGPLEIRHWGQGNAEEFLWYPLPNIRVTRTKDAAGTVIRKVGTLHLDGLGSVRAVTDAAETYTFWDYQRGAWEKDHGLRIDHLLLSPQAADRFKKAGIDRAERGKEKPSDHVPVWVELK